MVRHFISAVALVVCAAVYAFAGDQVTFVLSNGQRVNGELAAGTNLHNGQLSLGNQSFPIDQVAAIDVIGGTPSALELSRVPRSSAQAIVMRSGHSEAGKFINISGDSVQWEDHFGQLQNYPLRDVARVYLNSRNARVAYAGGETSTSQAAQTPTAEDQPGAVRVMANQPWTETGITVKAGDLVTFQARGQVAIARGGPDTFAGPDGKGDLRSRSYPDPDMPAGGLIGKVGNSAPFSIGSNSQPIRMPANGRLLLGVNDNEFGDNSGYFSVVVRKTGRRQ